MFSSMQFSNSLPVLTLVTASELMLKYNFHLPLMFEEVLGANTQTYRNNHQSYHVKLDLIKNN